MTKKIANTIIDLIANPYKDDFFYLDKEQGSHTFDPEKRVLTGDFVYNGAPYFKNESIILNNTEYFFVFNQSFYLVIFLFLLEQQHLNYSQPENIESIMLQYNRLGGAVVKEHQIKFLKPIFGTPGIKIPYTHTIEKHKKFKDSNIFFTKLNIGNSEITTKSSLVNRDLHQVHNVK